jgi:hypothetical protein
MTGNALTPAEWREDAARYRRSADHMRKLIAQEEAPGGSYGRLPEWPELKTTLLEYVELCERDAEAAMAEAAKRQH